jgi:PAS domain S-box-containing protein
VVKAKTTSSSLVVRCIFAALTVAAALAARMFLVRWTGTGAPFVLFFLTVLVSAFFWGAVPGLLAGLTATILSAVLFVYQAGYTASQAVAQSALFIIETSIVAVLADRFARAKRRAELNERAARQAEIQIENAHRAILKREAKLREAQSLANFGDWTWDSRSDVVEWSEEIYRIFGRDPGSPAPTFYGEHPALFTPDSMARLRAAVEKAMQYSTPYELELELIRPDGSLRSIMARGQPSFDASGYVAGLHGTVQDVTELKRLQRMREEWTSVIAHDLRQPIGTIVMCVELLSRAADTKSDDKAKFTDRIRSSAFTLARMVDDLMDVSQLESQRLHLERKWIDPQRVVHETIERLSYILKDHQIDISNGGDLVPIFADPGRMEQILGNLLSNAVKYGDPKKQIIVRLDRHEDEIEIGVTNFGHGIPPEDLPRLFERFSRSKSTRRAHPGLGLGLYIAKGLVEAHGGRIWVQSASEAATTFHFTLPIRLILTKEVA